MLQIQLISESVGTLNIDNVIDINALTQSIKRSSEVSEGVIFEMVLDVEFIKEGREFLKKAFEQTGGIDAKVEVKVFEYDPNRRRWDLFFNGKINFNRYELTEDRCIVNIEQTGFNMDIINQLEKDIDIETTETISGAALPAQQSFVVPFHSKAIFKRFNVNTDFEPEVFPPDPQPFLNESENLIYFAPKNSSEQLYYFLYNISDSTIDEIAERFNYPFQVSTDEPKSVSKYIFKFTEPATLKIRVRPVIRVIVVFGSIKDFELRWFISYGKPGNYTTIQVGNTLRRDNTKSINEVLTGTGYNNDYGFEYNIEVEEGDEFYYFTEFGIDNEDQITGVASYCDSPSNTGSKNLKLSIDALTLSKSSTCKVIFLHDAIKRCVEHITNERDSFYSDLLGRQDAGYSTDGKGAMVTITNGSLIRGADKNIFDNLKSLIGLANSLYCVGFGFETVDGKKRLRLEQIDYFYNKNLKSVSLGKVYNVKSKLDRSKFYNSIEYGYSGKIDIGQVNGVDEFNTVRRASIPIKNTKNTIKAATKYKGGGYLIEYQRRLSVTSDDGKYDDDNFVVELIRNGNGFEVRRNQEITATNVISPETSYNLNISPGRMLLNWRKYIKSCLIRSSDKIVKFSFGEVNYLLTTNKNGDGFTINENGNFDLSGIDALWEPFIYTVENVKMSRNDFKQIRDNPFGYIEFQDQFNETFNGFISSEGIEYDSNKGTATINLIKVFR